MVEQRKNFEAELVEYLASEFFSGDLGDFARQTDWYTKQHIDSWAKGKKKPQRATLRWLLSSTIAPRFKVVAEFAPVDLDSSADIKQALRDVLSPHENRAGVYSFYDSMCNVVYVGKASSSLLDEMYQRLRAPLGIKFPKSVKRAPTERWNVVSYVSAYEIPHVDHLDYPRHVEALVLRLSKPVGNKVLGWLDQSAPPKEG